MKRFIIIFFLLLFVFPLSFSASDTGQISITAEDAENTADDFIKNSEANSLYDKTPESAKEYLKMLGIESISVKSILSLTPGQFFKLIFYSVKDYIKAPFLMLIQIIAVIIISSVLSNFGGEFFDKNIKTAYMLAATLSIAVICIKPLIACIEKSASVINESSIFLSSFVPVFAGVMTAGGQAVSGTVYNMIIFGAAQVISHFAVTYLVPMLSIFMAFSLISSISSGINFSAAIKAIKSFVTFVMTLSLTVFVGLLTIQGVVAAGADNATTKATKFLLGSFVPVVGSALGDALNSVYGCMRLIKSAVGVYGIVASVAIFLPVLIETLLMMVAVKLAVIISEVSDSGGLSKLLSAAHDVLSILLGMLFCFILFTIISTTIVLVMGINV